MQSHPLWSRRLGATAATRATATRTAGLAIAVATAVTLAACTPTDTPATGPLADAPATPRADATTPGAPWDLISGTQATINGAIWQYPVPFGVGTGNIQPFLSLSTQGNNTTQECFNQDAGKVLDCVRAGGAGDKGYTRSLQLNHVPIIKVGGTYYREIILDANESNSVPAGQFSLDWFELYLCYDAAAPTWTSTTQFSANPNCMRAYDTRDAGGRTWARATDAATRGSGNALDYRILIPESRFAQFGDVNIENACPYNPTADCGYFLVLHTAMGGQGGDWSSGSTFEEFSVIERPWVTITKTAVPAFTRTYSWQLTKAVDPTALTLWTGTSGTANYTVTATRSAQDGDYRVSGTITVTNPSTETVVVNKPTDQIGTLVVPVTCPGGEGPYTIAAGGSLVCTYQQTLGGADPLTNTASVEIVDGAVSTATAAIDFTGVSPTIVGSASVDVTDQFDGGTPTSLGTANGSRTFTYSHTLTCGDAVGQRTVNNTARIASESLSASAAVTLTCVNLTVSKTATPAYTQTNSWDIAKSVTPTSMNLYNGDTQVAAYTITATRTVTPSAYSVSGDITVTNPSAVALQVTSLADVLTGGITASLTGTGCAPTTGTPTTIAAGQSLTCQYSAALPNNDTRTNTASATGRIGASGPTKSVSGTATVNFSGVQATVVGPTSVTVTDSYKGGAPVTLGTASAIGATTFQFSKTLACPGDAGSNGNVARLVETDQTASASVAVTCRALTVTKTATTAFRRTFLWQIEKRRDAGAPASLLLDGGQTYQYPFAVAVSTTGFTDDAWTVSGTISITAPAGAPTRRLVALTDVISPSIDATPTCTGGGFPRTIAAGQTISCTYGPQALPNGDARTNTATAALQNVRIDAAGTALDGDTTTWSGTASVSFGATVPSRVNGCVNVTDLGGLNGYPATNQLQALGEVCVPAHPATATSRTFSYTDAIGPLQSVGSCGNYRYDNTARIVETNQTATLQTPITWECRGSGCTLTQGYWKTHNPSFGVRNGGTRRGPPVHDWSEASAWARWDAWRFFGGTPAPVPAADPAITPVPTPANGLPSWFATFTTPPRGNAYYQAAHQFMAATLNRANGAGVPPAVHTALASAYQFFLTASPLTNWTKEQRAMLLQWSSLFGQYNEGKIAGYPHCSEDASSES